LPGEIRQHGWINIARSGKFFDAFPTGTDEVVTVAKVVNMSKKGNFDRVVLDTGSTGQTLRVLSTPGFMAELIDPLLAISQKVN
jgi:anion-transporting  ArsA/GET3 family ATPase